MIRASDRFPMENWNLRSGKLMPSICDEKRIRVRKVRLWCLLMIRLLVPVLSAQDLIKKCADAYFLFQEMSRPLIRERTTLTK